MERNLENIISETIYKPVFHEFFRDGKTVGAIEVISKSVALNFYESTIKIVIEEENSILKFKNHTAFQNTNDLIKWTRNEFIKDSTTTVIWNKKGAIIDNSGKTILIANETPVFPDFVFYLPLYQLSCGINPQLEFVYLNSQSTEPIFDCKLVIGEQEEIFIDGEKFYSTKILEYKNGKESNIFYMSKEGQILKADWGQAVSISSRDRNATLSKLSKASRDFLDSV